MTKELELPPSDWKEVYEKLADECKSSKTNIDEGFMYVDKYWKDLM